jgi:hypothetical protein
MEQAHLNRRALLGGLGAIAGLMPLRAGAATWLLNLAIHDEKENDMNQITFTKTAPPAWTNSLKHRSLSLHLVTLALSRSLRIRNHRLQEPQTGSAYLTLAELHEKFRL